MAIPASDLTNVHTNASTDDPSQARAELDAAILKVNSLIDAITTAGANNGLKLDGNSNISQGVNHADSLSTLPVITGGSTTVYTATLGITAYDTNRVYEVRINATNTGSCTVNFDSIGAKTVKTLLGDTLLAGQLKITQIAKLYYDGTDLILLNPHILAIAFRVKLSANMFNITGLTKITFDSKDFDINSDFDIVTNNRFTPTIAGKYRLRAFLDWSSTTSGNTIIIRITKNGAFHQQYRMITGGTFANISIERIVEANGTTDYFEIQGQNASISTSDITSGSGTTYFEGAFLGT